MLSIDTLKGLPIVAHTHKLMGLVGTMIGLQYLKMEEIPLIPTRKTPMKVAVYAPLDAAPMTNWRGSTGHEPVYKAFDPTL